MHPLSPEIGIGFGVLGTKETGADSAKEEIGAAGWLLPVVYKLVH